jgi:hypothetical protein
MQFVLAGFRQVDNVRRYYFDVVGEDRTRKQVVVAADLGLVHQYRIPLQELPVLCRRLLEGRVKIETITFTEREMAQYADERSQAASAAAAKRRTHRPPVSDRVGNAWRGAMTPKGTR